MCVGMAEEVGFEPMGHFCVLVCFQEIGRSATLPVLVELGEGLGPPVNASLQMRCSRRCANPAYGIKSGSGSLRSLTRIKQDSR